VPMFTDETAGSRYRDVFRPAHEMEPGRDDPASERQRASS
jgi:hypothetical protein